MERNRVGEGSQHLGWRAPGAPRPPHAWRDPDLGPHTRCIATAPGASLPAPALGESRVFAASHFPSRGRPDPGERARSNLPRLPASPVFLLSDLGAAQRLGGVGEGAERSGTISHSAGAVHGPGRRGPPRRGRAREKELGGPGRPERLGAGSSTRGWGRGAGRLPIATPGRGARAPTAARRGKSRGEGGSRSPSRGRLVRLPVSPRGAGRGGWPGEGGKGSGEGAGKGGALVRCSLGAALATATAAASFPIHSNKQDGCRYGAALPAAQILGSNRQDVYGQKRPCAPARPAGAADGAAQAR